METEISTKNTKNEILAAYEDLMKKAQEKKTEEPKKVQERQKQETLVKNAGDLTYEGIVKDISDLKVGLSSGLDKLGENFVSEFKKFEGLQQAIQIEKQGLEDLYQLSANTDSLSVMLLAQKEKKEQFEQEMAIRKAELEVKMKSEKEYFDTEMAEKKALWKKEQETSAARMKEETDEAKKSKAREEEEFQYNLKITRKKESDLHEEKRQKLEKELSEKKALFEKEFTEREANVKEAETELHGLREKSKAFQSELEKAAEVAVKSATEKLKAEFRFEKELTAKQTEGDLMLKAQTIETLISKIKDLEVSIKEFSQKAATAESSVKDIAIKAIESSSKMHFIEKSKDLSGKE
ncbi:MAG: hypothetical protein GZ094_10965 [Mariniphaga sp.]|nr:hypothetical protein [Mariniphaga sp.]